MRRRVVESWLTNASELSFTVPFCQLLVSKGQRVAHISSQGPMEQGKDVIAVDSRGVIHCYQLKCGKINGRVWSKIKSEIDQLVELPPSHPSIPAKVSVWNAYLVTNGTIANPTARDISDYANVKHAKGYARLQTITGTELVADFTNFYGSYLPVDVIDLQRFLEMYNQSGDSLNAEEFKTFFERFFDERNQASVQKKVELIRASLMLCNYLLTYKYARSNHLEIVKAHVLLLGCIYRFAAINELKDARWKDTEALAYEAIEVEFRQLIDELLDHPADFVQSEYGVGSEAVAYPIRCTELLGYLGAYMNYCAMRSVTPYRPSAVEAAVDKLRLHRALFGECMTPLFVNYIVSLPTIGSRATMAPESSLLMLEMLKLHVGDGQGLPSPYYGIVESVEWQVGINVRETREGFRHQSYSIRSLTMLLARLGQRDLLNACWKLISRISQLEAVPAQAEDQLLWRIEKGTVVGTFPEMEQSWRVLVAEASRDHTANLPAVLRSRKHYIPFFINVMPHRCSHKLALVLFDAVERGAGSG